MNTKHIWPCFLLLGACASTQGLPSPTSTPLHIPLSDTLRNACEIVPVPTEKELDSAIDSALAKPKSEVKADIKKYVGGREVKHNGALGVCNVRGDSLVKLVDEANAKFNSLAATH